MRRAISDVLSAQANFGPRLRSKLGEKQTTVRPPSTVQFEYWKGEEQERDYQESTTYNSLQSVKRRDKPTKLLGIKPKAN